MGLPRGAGAWLVHDQVCREQARHGDLLLVDRGEEGERVAGQQVVQGGGMAYTTIRHVLATVINSQPRQGSYR